MCLNYVFSSITRYVLVFNDNCHKGRQGNFYAIASVISEEYKVVLQRSIKTKSKYEAVAVLAQDREQWREIVQTVTLKY
jgi:hypothetical protein